jgi:hypothetical protein
MAEKPVETGKSPRRSRKGALAAAALFPALVSAGVFAPGLVQLAMQSGEDAAQGTLREGAPSAFERRPLPAPRDPAIAFTPVALELDRLFFETEYRGIEPSQDFGGAPGGGAGAAPTPGEIAQLLSFPRSDTDPILLDMLDPHAEELVFKDALVPEQVADVLVPDQGEMFLPLCGAFPSSDCIRFDDFTPVLPRGVPIPEPASAGLVAIGLGVLASLRARRRSR